MKACLERFVHFVLSANTAAIPYLAGVCTSLLWGKARAQCSGLQHGGYLGAMEPDNGG